MNDDSIQDFERATNFFPPHHHTIQREEEATSNNNTIQFPTASQKPSLQFNLYHHEVLPRRSLFASPCTVGLS
jgi:hypothetical protein